MFVDRFDSIQFSSEQLFDLLVEVLSDGAQEIVSREPVLVSHAVPPKKIISNGSSFSVTERFSVTAKSTKRKEKERKEKRTQPVLSM